MKGPKIFIGVTEVSGIAAGLQRGFSELGLESCVRLSVPHPFGYHSTEEGFLHQVWARLGLLRKQTGRNRPIKKALFVVLHGLWSWIVFVRALFEFDVFILLYGRTITMSVLELRILRFFGKRVIFVYVGSDARPPYMSALSFPDVSSVQEALLLERASLRQKKKLNEREKYANYIVNSPATAQFHSKPYINWFSMGVPRVFPASLNAASSPHGQRLRVLHSPSNPEVKGSREIRKVIDRLVAKGLPIDWIELQNVPNAVVMNALQSCDFVVDQLYSDTPMAIFATEAAYWGKPAIVGGYFSDVVTAYIKPDDLPPSLFVRPEALEVAIERMAVDADFRHRLGEEARRFVRTRWSPKAVAERYSRLLADDVPDEWWCRPEDCRYVFGCGTSSEDVARKVELMLRHGGSSALHVMDKPELERALEQLTQVVHAE